MTAVLLRGRHGLGDNIYQRAIVRELAIQRSVYLQTPYPQFVSDLPIKCVRMDATLRTQRKNMERLVHVWHVPPSNLRPQVIGYAGSKGSMLQGFCDSAGVALERVTFDLPSFGPPRQPARPYIVLRPATIRKEWAAPARNPDPAYLVLAAELLRPHFDIVSVADLAPEAEWALEPLPYADERYHAGELGLEDLMTLIEGAAGVVAGVGWVVPAALAYRVPLFLIYGGSGHHDGPDRIFDPRLPMGLVHHAIPDNFCRCANRQHECDKRIATIGFQVEQWAMGLRASRSTAVAA